MTTIPSLRDLVSSVCAYSRDFKRTLGNFDVFAADAGKEIKWQNTTLPILYSQAAHADVFESKRLEGSVLAQGMSYATKALCELFEAVITKDGNFGVTVSRSDNTDPLMPGYQCNFVTGDNYQFSKGVKVDSGNEEISYSVITPNEERATVSPIGDKGKYMLINATDRQVTPGSVSNGVSLFADSLNTIAESEPMQNHLLALQ